MDLHECVHDLKPTATKAAHSSPHVMSSGFLLIPWHMTSACDKSVCKHCTQWKSQTILEHSPWFSHSTLKVLSHTEDLEALLVQVLKLCIHLWDFCHQIYTMELNGTWSVVVPMMKNWISRKNAPITPDKSQSKQSSFDLYCLWQKDRCLRTWTIENQINHLFTLLSGPLTSDFWSFQPHLTASHGRP